MSSTAVSPAQSRVRWVICALLFFATVIAYVDRGVLAYLQHDLQVIIGWNAKQYSYMTSAFQLAYAIGLVCAGRLTDRLGTRKGFAIAITFWSVAAMLPGAASSVATFALAMFLLGLGEAANFPACIKTVAEWFPKKERALATGLFNAGANAGAIAVPAVVPLLAGLLGWRGAFVATGATGFIWLAFWLALYKKPEAHPLVSPSELRHIQSDPAESAVSVPWLRIIPRRQAWAFAVAKMLSDPIWWFYLFWLPSYLQETFHLDIHSNRMPVIVAYAISTVGSIYGGYLSGALIKRGYSINMGRKVAMGVCALAVLPVLYAPFSHSLWVVVGLVGLAMAAHQGWSANLFTLVGDMFPKSAVGSVVGFGGMIGSAAGVVFQLAVGASVDPKNPGSYIPIFAVCGCSYLIALLAVHLLAPRLEPAKLD
ncbi:MAG TPA: MFS transporter [Candidatus Sulfopaludibacter sp.]|nr:MFS transporter [Candidatus Sulfopaludibacter sp.]